MINAGGSDKIEGKKAAGINKPLELHKKILQKCSNGSYFPLSS